MLRNYHNQKKMTVNHGVLGSSPCAGAKKEALTFASASFFCCNG